MKKMHFDTATFWLVNSVYNPHRARQLFIPLDQMVSAHMDKFEDMIEWINVKKEHII